MNKCVWIEAPGNVKIKEMPMPEANGNEALLKILYGGICGSDLSIYRGKFAYASYPRIPGHEFSAEIVKIGKNGSGLEEGMIVTANPYFNCGTCYSCRRGLVNCCSSNQTMGVQRDGAFAQYISMPLDRIFDGRGINARTLALIEPFCISYHGVQRANIHKGEKVLVIGAGTIGVLAAIAAKELGARVYMCDISQAKLDFTLNFGIDGVFLNDGQGLQNAIKEITHGDGFDVTIEAVGRPETFQDCIDAVAFGGRMILLGVSERNLDFGFTIIQKKELNIIGSRNALNEDFIRLIEIVRNGGLDLEKFISREYSFEDAKNAFKDYDEDYGKILKVVLKF